MLFDNFVLGLINLIHLLVILFVIIVPFTNYTFLLLIHSVIVPFIMLHWLLNNDTCALTLMEKYFRIQMNGGEYVDVKDCISYKLIGPVYNFMNDHVDYSKWTWVMTSTLWFITLYKLRSKYINDEFEEFKNFFSTMNLSR